MSGRERQWALHALSRVVPRRAGEGDAVSELVRRLEAEADKIESGAGMPTHVGAGLRVAIRIVEQFEFEGGYQADADLLDDIRRAGCPLQHNTWCPWCGRWEAGDGHQPTCIWLRIEARGERS